MTKLLLILSLCSILLSCSNSSQEEKWKLTWEENFDGTSLDTSRWSKIPRGGSDWNKHMSYNDACYAIENGHLILKGIVNPDPNTDSVPYLTGGVWTKDKVYFKDGRIEIRAKLEEAQGAWPAYWMLPKDKKWPIGGEIDIMEHLNFDNIIYQTVHSHYTHNLGIGDNPPKGSTIGIKRNDYNIYALEMYADSLVFFVNNQHCFTYPRIETDQEGQFPFDYDFYLLLDMQLGGSWVGSVKAEDLPVEMAIDWVRFYKMEN